MSKLPVLESAAQQRGTSTLAEKKVDHNIVEFGNSVALGLQLDYFNDVRLSPFCPQQEPDTNGSPPIFALEEGRSCAAISQATPAKKTRFNLIPEVMMLHDDESEPDEPLVVAPLADRRQDLEDTSDSEDSDGVTSHPLGLVDTPGSSFRYPSSSGLPIQEMPELAQSSKITPSVDLILALTNSETQSTNFLMNAHSLRLAQSLELLKTVQSARTC